MKGSALPGPAVWTGRTLSTLVALFLAADGVVALFRPDLLQEASAAIGFAPGSSLVIGSVALTCALLYAMPRTAVLGAVLTTGFLGGAVAAHVRVSPDPFSPEVLPALTVGVLGWLGLWLRTPGLRGLLPITRRA